MWPFKRQAPKPHVAPIPQRIVGRYFLKEWDYENICDLYVLIEEIEITPHNEVQKLFLGGPVGPSWCENGAPVVLPSRVAAGNLGWAKVTARDLGFKFIVKQVV